MRPILLLPFLALLLSGGCDTTPSGPNDGIPVGPEIGKRAPNVTQDDPDGNEVSLWQFHGKVVLLDFWATWCGPCMHELPHVKSIWEANKGKEFMIVSVSLDIDLGDWRSVVRDQGLGWTQMTDGRGPLNEAVGYYGIEAIPRTYLLDRRGVIVGIDVRGAALDSAIAAELAR